MELKKISLCITTYNRVDMTMESFAGVLGDDRVSEIIISDDHSNSEVFDELEKRINALSNTKVKLMRTESNLGMSRNKKLSVFLATNPQCIVFDSDNIIGKDYIDALFAVGKFLPDVIYCPEFARPNFNYTIFRNHLVSKSNIRSYVDDNMFGCLLNTCNYVVNRERYLEVYRYNPEIQAADTIHFNKLWLESGGMLNVVSGMQYLHRVHDGSGFLKDCQKNLDMAEAIRQQIKAL